MAALSLNSSTSSSYGAQASAEKPATPMEAHTSQLNKISLEVCRLTQRLEKIAERFCGPNPPQAKEAGTEEATPSGAIQVAQFCTRRISGQLGDLDEVINRLDGAI